MREARLAIAVHTELVRSAMPKRTGHQLDLIELRRRKVRAPVDHACDAAHLWHEGYKETEGREGL